MTTGRGLLCKEERPSFDDTARDLKGILLKPATVERLRLGPVGGCIVSPVWLGSSFKTWLSSLPVELPFLGFPISGGGKIYRLSSGDMISHAGDRGLRIILARLRRTLYHGGIRLGRGGPILCRGSIFGELYLSRLGGSSSFPVSGIFFLSSAA